MRTWTRLIGAWAIGCSMTILSPFMTAAQEPAEEQRPRVELSAGTWFSVGNTTWAHDASSVPGLGNPTSKLSYKDVGTNVIDLTAKVWVIPRVFGRLNFGYAGIGGGRLTDNDFSSTGGQHLISSTISNTPGNNMWYLNADVGGRAKEFLNHRGYLDLFGGYQYWHTEYEAVGVGVVVCDPTVFNCAAPLPPPGQTVITNTTNWHSIRVGASTEYRLTRRLSVLGTLALIPISVLDNKDVHHLRGDLQQNPSFSMVGYGVGANVDIGARFMITNNLAANLGYRLYYNRVLSGDLTTHPAAGPSDSFPLTQFESLRHGFTAGLSLIF